MFHRRFRVRRRGPMAGFASNCLVVRKTVHLYDVYVTISASLATRVSNSTSHDCFKGRGSVVSEASKGLGHEVMSGENQAQDKQGEKDHQTIDLLGHGISWDFGGPRFLPQAPLGNAPPRPSFLLGLVRGETPC